MVDCGMTCVKYLIFVFNFLFWLSGIAIIAVGAIIQVELNKYNGVLDSSFTAGAILLIVVGCIVTIIAFFGCCGAIKEHHCMIMTFAVLLGIIFVLELAAGITCYVYRDKINQIASDKFTTAWMQYDPQVAPDITQAIDVIQHDLHCCGVNGTADWQVIPWGLRNGAAPDSCCEKETTGCAKAGSTLFARGCYDQIKAVLEHDVIIVAGVGIGVAFIQLIGIVFACCLASAIRKNYEVV